MQRVDMTANSYSRGPTSTWPGVAIACLGILAN
jgi:hypothetical protein